MEKPPLKFIERLEHLLESWKKSFGHYESLKAETVQAVVRWEWTTRERYSQLPFHFLRFPGRGRVLRDAPSSVGNYIQYGFDQHGRVRLHRRFQYRSIKPANLLKKLTGNQGLSKELYSETFSQYFDDRVESVEFSVSPHIPLSIQQIVFKDGKVGYEYRFQINGYTPLYGVKGKNPDELYEWLDYNGRFKTAEEYVYEKNRLRMILGYYEVPGIPPYSASEQFTYNEAGNLQGIDRIYEDGQKQAVYRKRRKGQSFQALREETTHKLVEAILQKVEAANIQEKIYCIELYYQKGIQHFPPHLILAPESYRLKLIHTADPIAQSSIFSPLIGNEWFFEIDDLETLEMCQVLEQEILAGEKWDTATSILRDIAAALTRHDWSEILDVTPDFVVFALDPEMEGDQIVQILSNSVSEGQIQAWMDQGWLE